jgi:hypothetical protein
VRRDVGRFDERDIDGDLLLDVRGELGRRHDHRLEA